MFMKHVTLAIPENQFAFYLKLFKKLEAVTVTEVTSDEDFSIPEEHQKIILDRIKNTPKDQYLKWEQVKNKFHL